MPISLMLLHFVSDLNVCLQITDSVVVARLLNATLVVPQLDHRSYWKDPRFVSPFNVTSVIVFSASTHFSLSYSNVGFIACS